MMLGDMKQTIDNLGDRDKAIAGEIDAFMVACIDLMQKVGTPLARMQEMAKGSAGQTSIETQIYAQMLAGVGKAAQDAYGSICQAVTVAAASQVIERRRLQTETMLAIKKGRD
jgi:hypothetical protein